MDEDKGFKNIYRALVKSDLIVRLFSYFRYHNNKELMFIYSLVSGKIDISGNLVEIHATDKKSDGYKYIIDNLNKDYDCLVCAGGNGALSEAVSALINKNMDMPLGYIPS